MRHRRRNCVLFWTIHVNTSLLFFTIKKIHFSKITKPGKKEPLRNWMHTASVGEARLLSKQQQCDRGGHSRENQGKVGQGTSQRRGTIFPGQTHGSTDPPTGPVHVHAVTRVPPWLCGRPSVLLSYHLILLGQMSIVQPSKLPSVQYGQQKSMRNTGPTCSRRRLKSEPSWLESLFCYQLAVDKLSKPSRLRFFRLYMGWQLYLPHDYGNRWYHIKEVLQKLCGTWWVLNKHQLLWLSP